MALAAPGIGTDIRVRAATSRACNIRISSTRICSRIGTGPSVTRRSLKFCAMPNMSPNAFGLLDGIDFERRVSRRRSYDEDAAIWTLTAASGETLSARFCVMATGCLSDAELAGARWLFIVSGRHSSHRTLAA